MGRLLLEVQSATKRFSFKKHFADTISVLGGWKGILAIFVFVLLFYLLVEYVVANGRRKRSLKRN